MASRNCKFRSLVDCYGHFPLKNRFGGDQVPLELNRRDFTLDLQGTTDPVHIRGPKKDIDKRQATIDRGTSKAFVTIWGSKTVKGSPFYTQEKNDISWYFPIPVNKIRSRRTEEKCP